MRKFFKGVPWLILILTLICYSAILVPPKNFWPAGIIVYGIPPLLLINLLLIIYLAILKRVSLIGPLIALLIGMLFLKITVHFNIAKEVTLNKKFDILSFNAESFKMDSHNIGLSSEMIDWILNDSSSIKCIQEYHSHNQSPKLNLSNKIINNGYDLYLFDSDPNDDVDDGLAIFSRYPIINKGSILLNENSGNNCIYTDLKIEEDTIRIYNVHLYSMGIPLNAYKDPDNYESKLQSLIRKLKRGAINRSNEIDQLIRHTAECPYPFLICGDFNDIPYSHNYLTLRNHFTNAFEEAGHGFGFSFNHKLFFLRIDHQFIGEGIRPLFYQVDRSMKESDHFPTRGIYQLP
jgi:endonuclease/exonuclease/phosphatase family metal-dependent hydrolase